MKVGFAVCAAALLGSSLADQQPTFKSGTRTVAVYATVTDDTGRLVTDLTRDDFEIFEDNKPRPLTLFSSDTQPISVVIMLDRSGSMKWNFRLVEAATEEFIRRMLPADKARIGSFAERVQIDPPEFTSNQEELIRIVRSELQKAGPTPLWNAVNDSMTALTDQEGRRVVLVFTDGHDNPMNMRLANSNVMEVMNKGQRDDVMVYAIGLESRTQPGSGAGLPRAPLGGFGGNPLGVERPDPGLPMIAEETGGGYFELKRADNLSATFTRVAEELHKQYALGFEPAKLDGKSHKVKVKVKRNGMTVRARERYVATKQ
jgi:Ca-activated chloride channel homolog